MSRAPGAPRRIGETDVERVTRLTLETTPRAATHCSTWAMACRRLVRTAIGRSGPRSPGNRIGSQPMLPMRSGSVERRTHHYSRHRTTSVNSERWDPRERH
jgi:hypothetical protein